MIYNLGNICYSRSGDKGRNSNVGLIFINSKIYKWALKNITTSKVKKHLKNVVKGEVKRYELDNIHSLNFILNDSLGGGGSDSLINDAQGKTHGQLILLMKIDLPNSLRRYVNE